MKNQTSFTKATAPNRGRFGKDHPRWRGGYSAGSQKEYLRTLRLAALEALGGVCSRCGFSDARALQIDHIHGSGAKERKERTYKGNFHTHVLKSFLNGENKYQLLCANCNWIKRSENGEALGKPKKLN